METNMFTELPGDAKSFYFSVMVAAINALKLNTFLDNFDAARFNFDGKDHSKEFAAGAHAHYFDWFMKNHERLFAAYSALDDEASKRMFLYLIAYRLAGHLCVKLPVEFARKKRQYKEYKALENPKPSTLTAGGLFGKLKRFDFSFEGERYVADCMGFEWYLFRGQYFYSREGVSIRPERGDTVIDGGACTGDTALVFSNAVGAAGKVYSFDPVADHLAILAHNARQFPYPNVEVMPYGLSDHNVDADPIVINQYAPGFHAGTNLRIPLRSIDSLVADGRIDKIDFIKLDIEGAEMETLRGAAQSIARFKPKLAISLYHKPNDLFEIISHVKQSYPFYSCHLDHYTIHGEETVLYCRA
jgi:FkbM family methyltransferase